MNSKRKIEIKCFGLNEYGEGLFQVGKTTFSAFNLLPKEVALVEPITQNYYKVIKIVKENNSRIKPKCDTFNKCGSCQLLHMSYEDQIKLKENYVIGAFKKYKLNHKIDEIITSNCQEAFRNKMQVAYKYKDKELVYGFYEENSHKIIPHSYCLIHSKEQNDIAKKIAKIMKELKIAPYDEDKKTGIIRFVLIRETKFNPNKEILVTIVTPSSFFPSRSEFIKKLKEEKITTIIQNINSRKTSIILGENETILHGKGYITDTLCGLNFNISSKTFYQVNPHQTELLYQKVVELAKLTRNETVLDCYCGVGTIGMILAKHAKFVTGVENNLTSVMNARVNASNNNIKNIKFVHMDATEFIKQLVDQKITYDCLVMDPPRSGSTTIFLKSLELLKPKKIVYVSCDAKTQARDISELESYKIEKKVIVDMFVHTYHIESICLLTLNK